MTDVISIIVIAITWLIGFVALWSTNGSWLGALIGLPSLAICVVLAARCAWIGMGEQ